MKHAINHYINAFLLAGFTSLASAQAVQDNQSPKPPSTATDESKTAASNARRLAYLHRAEEISLKVEYDVLAMVAQTHVAANYARVGITRSVDCKRAAVAAEKGFPDLFKRVYANALEARQILSDIEEDEKLTRIAGFNMLADFWQANVDVINPVCIAAAAPKPDKKAVSQARQLKP